MEYAGHCLQSGEIVNLSVNIQILAAQEQIPNALFPRRAGLILTKSRGDKQLDCSREEDKVSFKLRVYEVYL